MKTPHLPLYLVLALFLLAVLTGLTFAQDTTAPTQEYRFLSTTKTSTFEKELNNAAKDGFRLVRLAKAFNDTGLGSLLVREPNAEVRYEYRVLATNRLSTMKKELEDASADGFEFRGITTQNKPIPYTLPETITVMERPAGQTKLRFEYRFLSTQREGTMQKEMDVAVSEGFVPIELVVGQDSNAFSMVFGSPQFKMTVVLSRDVSNPGAEMGAHEYRLLKTTRISTMEKEMNQLAKEGFQFHLTSIGAITIMARRLKDGAQRYEYKLLGTQRTGTMQKELSELGAQGYQFLGTSTGAGGLASVMEREVGPNSQSTTKYDYKFLAATREGTTEREISEAIAAGYQFLEISTLGERLVVLGKRTEPK